MLYRLNSSENREARSGPELQTLPRSKTHLLQDYFFFSFGSVNRKINRSTRVILGHDASQRPDRSEQNRFMGGHLLRCRTDISKQLCYQSQDATCHPEPSLSSKGGQRHCEPTDEQLQHRSRRAHEKLPMFPWTTEAQQGSSQFLHGH